MSALHAALLLVLFVEVFSLAGLFCARRYLLPRLHHGEGMNEAVSGTVQAIGVFYGITVGLIAVAVWNTNSNASDRVSKEATSIAVLYRDISSYPSPRREQLRKSLRDYTVYVINEAWPAQRQGLIIPLTQRGTKLMDEFQAELYAFEPLNQGQIAMHSETLRAYNNLLENRRLRIDAVDHGLSGTMWAVIWVGAAISIGVAYLYRIADAWLHATLIFLMAGFLALVLFMITINDKPFYGTASVSPQPYQLILEKLIDVSQ